jgi:hypothetical protein
VIYAKIFVDYIQGAKFFGDQEFSGFCIVCPEKLADFRNVESRGICYVGKDILNANLAQETDPNFQSCSNLRRDYYYNAWTQEKPSDRYYALGNAWSNSEKEFVTDRYVEDASYLRMSNL